MKKSKKEKKKVVEKEKHTAFNRDDDSKNSSQLSSDIKELDEPNHKKQYMLFAAGIVLLATILLISAHLYSRKRGDRLRIIKYLTILVISVVILTSCQSSSSGSTKSGELLNDLNNCCIDNDIGQIGFTNCRQTHVI